MENNLIRMSIRVTPEVKSYFEKESKRTGVSQSALINLKLEDYITSKNFIDNMSEINSINKEKVK